MTNDSYDDLRDSVKSDPDREPLEKETGFLFSKNDDRMTVNTAEAGLMRRLLAHPEFRLKWYETTSDDGHRTVDAVEYNEEGHDGRKPVLLVAGTLPVGCLKVSKSARSGGGHADVITSGVL